MTKEETALLKTAEAMEAVKTMLAAIGELPDADARAVAVARTQFETAFLWTGNAAQGGGVLS